MMVNLIGSVLACEVQWIGRKSEADEAHNKDFVVERFQLAGKKLHIGVNE